MSRVLHVTDVYRPAVGGIEVFVGDLAARQTAAGHEVTVLTSTADRGASPQERFAVRRTSRWSAAAAGGLLGQAGGGYDVVHAHLSVCSPYTTLVARAAVAARIPTVITVHSMLADKGWVVRTVGRAAGWDRWPVMWTTVSAAAAGELRSLLVDAAPVTVVPNAIDVGWWAANGAHRRPPVPGRPVTILTVMRLVPRKRPMELVAILASLRAQVDPRVPLAAAVVGDGPLRHQVQRELHARGLAGWVTLTGRAGRSQIRDLCSLADVYVAPATRESFGIAALEARAAGLPVVAMRDGGVRDFVRDRVEGLLVDDDDAMADALAVLVTDAGRRSRIAHHNRTVAPHADWPMVVAAFERVYATAAELTGRPVRPGHDRRLWRVVTP